MVFISFCDKEQTHTIDVDIHFLFKISFHPQMPLEMKKSQSDQYSLYDGATHTHTSKDIDSLIA